MSNSNLPVLVMKKNPNQCMREVQIKHYCVPIYFWFKDKNTYLSCTLKRCNIGLDLRQVSWQCLTPLISTISHVLHLFLVIYVFPIFCSISFSFFQLIYGSNVQGSKEYVCHHHHGKKSLSCLTLLPDTVCGHSVTVTMHICQPE